jgi:hypothetical protein
LACSLRQAIAGKGATVENRNSNRYETEQPIACMVFTTNSFNDMFYGKMKNYCDLGMSAELQICFKVGTILIVRATGSSPECLSAKTEDGFRSISLVEVKWSKPLSANGNGCYGIGLKHLII